MQKSLTRLPGVIQHTGLSRASIYARLNPKAKEYDPSFPRPIALGARAVAWDSEAVDAWIKARIEASRKPGAA